MHIYATRRDLAVVGVACLVVGLVTGSLAPAGAANGDALVLGAKNNAITVTRLNTRGGLCIDNFRTGRPPLILKVIDNSASPFETNSTVLVGNLNADYLDGASLERIASHSGFCLTEDADDGSETYWGCAAGAEYLEKEGILHMTGSVEIIPSGTALHLPG